MRALCGVGGQSLQASMISEVSYADTIAVSGDVLRYCSLLQNADIVIKHSKRHEQSYLTICAASCLRMKCDG